MRSEQADRVRYRPEIDGLRAIAIIPVVLFHAGISQMSGGFIGVDIFFVISGYLITSIIVREITIDKFSIADFYKRRIVRIIPALCIMLIVVTVFSCVILFPKDLKEYGSSLTWSSLFSSNIFFALTTGYFKGPAEYKPLLHMWSLAVEEQFYIFFPILLPFLIKAFPKRVIIIILTLCLCSFAISLLGVRWYREWIFFLLPGRAWEIGIGALLALHGNFLVNPKLKILLASLGVALIIIGLIRLSPQSTFPSYNALLPCIGAALLIAFADGTSIGRVLGSRPFVAIGLISYPLYLWHWPVIVLVKTYYGDSFFGSLLYVVGISVALAVATTFLLERPLSYRLRRYSARTIIAGGAFLLISLAILGRMVETHAAWRTYSLQVLHLLSYQEYASSPERRSQFRAGTCFAETPELPPALRGSACRQLAPDRTNYLLLGDSHAAQYAQALIAKLSPQNVTQVTLATCPPLLDNKASACALVTKTVDDLLSHPQDVRLILAARWREADLPRIVKTIGLLRKHGYDITVLGPVPEYRADLPSLLARALVQNDPGLVSAAQSSDRATLDKKMRNALKGIRYVSTYDKLCPAGQCQTLIAPGTPMLFDSDHLTPAAVDVVLRNVPFGDTISVDSEPLANRSR